VFSPWKSEAEVYIFFSTLWGKFHYGSVLINFETFPRWIYLQVTESLYFCNVKVEERLQQLFPLQNRHREVNVSSGAVSTAYSVFKDSPFCSWNQLHPNVPNELPGTYFFGIEVVMVDAMHVMNTLI
jgi:hypothetical protein